MSRPLPPWTIACALVTGLVACTGQSPTAAPSAEGARPGWPATLAKAYTVSTLAGSKEGSVDGSGDGAQFDYPSGIAVQRDGTLIVSEQGNTRIRRVYPNGQALTLTGGTEGFQDGPLTTAQFSHPINVALDALGRIVVADAFGSHRLRRVDPASGVTTLAGSQQGFADGPAAEARFDNPTALAVSQDGTVYVADANNNRIRRCGPDGQVSTVAGSGKGYADGTGGEAKFNNPTGIALDSDGTLIVADTGNNRLRRVSPAGAVTTIAGSESSGRMDGPALQAQFNSPIGLAVDAKRNVYVVDGFNHAIRALAPDGQVVTLAGAGDGYADGDGKTARFSSPFGVAVDASGTLFVTDMGNHRIRKVQPTP